MTSRRVTLGVSAIVFVASAAMTIATCASMSTMGEMQMPGGWTMSHMWMVMPGQSWLGAMASFVEMWAVMMVAMMLPSLTPSLLRYRATLGLRVSGLQAGWLVVGVGVSYFAVWTALGIVVFPLGVAAAGAAMRDATFANAVPIVAGSAIVTASLLQLSAWKAQYLAHCRDISSVGLQMRIGVRTACRHGLCLGLHCIRSCAGITVIALCLGLMDLRVMAAVTVAVTAERRWHFLGRYHPDRGLLSFRAKRTRSARAVEESQSSR